jgi:hypothetical protein
MPKCVVTVRADGVQLQGPLQAPTFSVGLPELSLIAEIDSRAESSLDSLIQEVARRGGVESHRLTQFAKRLERTGRMARRLEKVPQPEIADKPALPTHPVFDIDSPKQLTLRMPLVLRLQQGRFEIVDHDGFRVVALTASEVHALDLLIKPVLARDALAANRSGAGKRALDRAQFARLLGRLEAAGLLGEPPSQASTGTITPADREVIVRETFAQHAAAQDATECERERRIGAKRTKIIPVAFDMGTPVGLGMVVAMAKAFDGGRLENHYDFRTDWVWDDDRLELFTMESAIYLFSNYLWSHERCIAVSEKVKARSPGSITIHGGPDTPKYERDVRAYFAAHPHIDITVRGEGELSAAHTLAALVDVIDDPKPDLSVLAGVEGICYREGDRVIVNPDRERIADVNTIPSPFLTGLFDAFRGVPDLFVTIETNRGCPYGCTFCDWGSATNSRIRQFELDRVFDELEWCSSAKVGAVSVADANFGIFKRDVDIAAKAAQLKIANGYPRGFGTSFAKNTVKHLKRIIEVLADAGILTQGVLSLQSMDPDTLDAIHRSNIKLEKYDDLAKEMRRAHLPLMIELMMGLPNSTLASFTEDLQQCIDREVPTRVNHTELLVNSPMNDPDYLAEHQIDTGVPIGPGKTPLLVSTASFTREDYREMENLRLSYLLFENFGVLRSIARFVRQETSQTEMRFYSLLHTTAAAAPAEWPLLHVVVTLGTSMMTAPYSWALVMAELRRFLVGELAINDDAALESVLRAQHALLPAHGRRFPVTVPLTHDVVAWHQAIIAAKEGGHRTDWTECVPRLADYGPGELTVDDQQGIAESSLGVNRELNMLGRNWELESPLSRARLASRPRGSAHPIWRHMEG